MNTIPGWRERLRAAIDRSGKKQSVIAREAEIAPETLSRILNAPHARPAFDTVVRIAHALNENVGFLLDEPGFTLSSDEQKQLYGVVRIIETALGLVRQTPQRQEPNAIPVGPRFDIPHAYAIRGARLIYEALGNSMLGVGIANGDLLFVKPVLSIPDAAGRVVVCRVHGGEYVKVLDIREGRMRLLSRNDRYAPIEVEMTDVRARTVGLIGIVVGRSGTLSDTPW